VSSTKPWERSNKRRSANRPLRRFLIVCEDEKSSVYYLRGFNIPVEYAEVVTEGGAGNTCFLVQKALKLREQAIYDRTPYAYIWCVIDRNSFPKENYDKAFQLAKGFGDVEVIWANQCFELWYLLHFCYRNTAIERDELPSELSRADRLGKKYDKADKSIHGTLRDKTATAIAHAQQLEDYYGGDLKSVHENPSTNIHHLVKQLIKLKDGLVGQAVL